MSLILGYWLINANLAPRMARYRVKRPAVRRVIPMAARVTPVTLPPVTSVMVTQVTSVMAVQMDLGGGGVRGGGDGSVMAPAISVAAPAISVVADVTAVAGSGKFRAPDIRLMPHGLRSPRADPRHGRVLVTRPRAPWHDRGSHASSSTRLTPRAEPASATGARESVATGGIGQGEDMGEAGRGDDTGINGRRAAPEHGIGRRASGKLAL
jgi:hypothetical protein